MQVLFRELSLRSLDTLAADALALFIDLRERPLQGLPGLCDWRLCGKLSRVIQTGFFEGKGGEALLMPVGHRLGVPRLLAFGVGETGVAPEALVSRAFEAIARAGARSVLLSIAALGETPEQAASVWLRASRASRLERQILLGDPKVLGRAVRTVVGSDPGVQFENEPAANPAGQRLA